MYMSQEKEIRLRKGSNSKDVSHLKSLNTETLSHTFLCSFPRRNNQRKELLLSFISEFNSELRELLLIMVKQNSRLTKSGFKTISNNSERRGSMLTSIERKSFNVPAGKSSCDNLRRISNHWKNSVLKNHSIKIVHNNLQIREDDLISNSIYVKLEKDKLVQLYNIFQYISTVKLQFSKKEKEEPNINFDILKINDPMIQGIILNLIILKICSVIHEELVIKILKIIFKDYQITQNSLTRSSRKSFNNNKLTQFEDPEKLNEILKNIFQCDKIFLLGFYFSQKVEYLKMIETRSNEIREKHISTVNKIPNSEDSSFEILAIYINLIKKKNFNYEQFYSKDFHFDLRKKHILQVLCKFYDLELGLFPQIMAITQEIYDYLVFRKITSNPSISSSFYFKIFLEMRLCFFEYSDKTGKNQMKLYSSLSDKRYSEYKSKILTNEFYFQQEPKVKINNFKSKFLNSGSDYREIKAGVRTVLHFSEGLNSILSDKFHKFPIRKKILNNLGDISKSKPQPGMNIFFTKEKQCKDKEKRIILNKLVHRGGKDNFNTLQFFTLPTLKTENFFQTELLGGMKSKKFTSISQQFTQQHSQHSQNGNSRYNTIETESDKICESEYFKQTEKNEIIAKKTNIRLINKSVGSSPVKDYNKKPDSKLFLKHNRKLKENKIKSLHNFNKIDVNSNTIFIEESTRDTFKTKGIKPVFSQTQTLRIRNKFFNKHVKNSSSLELEKKLPKHNSTQDFLLCNYRF
jgi:hypothetical protein